MAKYDVTSDKIVLKSGEKDVTVLTGKKDTIELNGLAQKTTTLTGEKDILDLAGLKDLSGLTGLKDLEGLSGKTQIDLIFGSTDKSPTLIGDASEGYWYIKVDSTYFYGDDVTTTVDRN